MITAAYTLSDHTQTEDTVEQLKIQSFIRYMHNYHPNWKQNVRTEDNRISKQIIACHITLGEKDI